MYKSVIPFWETEDGELTRLVLLPVEENYGLPRGQAGWPRPAPDMGILEHFAELSRPYGVDIDIQDGLGVVKL